METDPALVPRLGVALRPRSGAACAHAPVPHAMGGPSGVVAVRLVELGGGVPLPRVAAPWDALPFVARVGLASLPLALPFGVGPLLFVARASAGR